MTIIQSATIGLLCVTASNLLWIVAAIPAGAWKWKLPLRTFLFGLLSSGAVAGTIGFIVARQL